jgi:hypothetical protein
MWKSRKPRLNASFRVAFENPYLSRCRVGLFYGRNSAMTIASCTGPAEWSRLNVSLVLASAPVVCLPAKWLPEPAVCIHAISAAARRDARLRSRCWPLERVEDFSFEQFVTQLSVERFYVTVFTWLPARSKRSWRQPRRSISRSAFATNSGPLSEGICVGMPRDNVLLLE